MASVRYSSPRFSENSEERWGRGEGREGKEGGKGREGEERGGKVRRGGGGKVRRGEGR